MTPDQTAHVTVENDQAVNLGQPEVREMTEHNDSKEESVLEFTQKTD